MRPILIFVCLFLAATALAAGPPADYTGLIWLESPTCQPCHQMQPTVIKLIVEGLPILDVSVMTAEELTQYGATVTPTTILYVAGRAVEKREGLLIEYTMRQMLKTIPATEQTPDQAAAKLQGWRNLPEAEAKRLADIVDEPALKKAIRQEYDRSTTLPLAEWSVRLTEANCTTCSRMGRCSWRRSNRLLHPRKVCMAVAVGV